MGLLGKKYIPVDHEEKLRNHKYTGEDHSILYNNFFSPIAGYCVEKWTPEWLAPNTITLMGLFNILIPYLCIWYYTVWDMQAFVPCWVYWLTFFCHFIYFHLDNMDGKQARKTGNSSPLGLIFDHGCDALSVYLQAVTIINCMQMGNDLWGLFTLYTPSMVFFISNLEELYTHKLYLPVINAAIEGVVITGFLILTAAIVGQSGMTQIYQVPLLVHIFGPQPLGKWLAIFVHIGAGLGVPFIFIRIYRHCGFAKVLESFTKCWYMLYSHGIVLYFMMYSEKKVPGFRYAILMLGFNMCKTLTYMLLCSSSRSRFNPFFLSNVLILGSFFVNTYLAVNGYSHLPEIPFLLYLTVFSFGNYVLFVRNVADQLCSILNIKVFTVKPKVKQN